jgi:two-component system chemotaxis sensor kinase CheA
MIAGDEVLVVVDVLGMIDAVKGKLSAAAGDTQSTRGADGKTNAVRRQSRILFAEDSAFFRGYIRQVLEEAGFTVEAVADGAEAWSVLESSAAGRFTVLLSDIEMPILDGFELATKVSSDARFKALPLIAITTRYSNADVERGRQAGFTRYLEKLNAEKLLSVLDEVTSAKELKRAAS